MIKKQILPDRMHFQPSGRQVLHRESPLHHLKLKSTQTDQEPTVLNRDIIKSKKAGFFPAESKTSLPILPKATFTTLLFEKMHQKFLRKQLLLLTHDFVPSRHLLKTEDIYNH